MKKVYPAAVVANIGVLSGGQFFGWASPTLPKLRQNDTEYPVHLTSDEASWIASLIMLGTPIGAIICALIVNIIGRKKTMLVAAIPLIISWVIIIFATSSWQLYISRLISGCGTGLVFTTAPMYVGEISPSEIRGYLLAIFTVASSLGTLLQYTIGPFLSVKNLALVSLITPCLFLIALIWLPESPYHLMQINEKQKAINSLIQLRGTKDVYEEAESIERSVKADLANKSNFRDLLFITSNRRAVTIVVCLSIFQHTTGFMAIMQYAQTLFDEAKTDLDGKYLTIIIGGVQLICAGICMFITDRYGRKLLLIISCIGAACTIAIVAIYFTLQHYRVNTSEFTWLSAIGLIMYFIMNSVGLAPVLPILSGEVYPMNVKALGGMLSLLVATLTSFIVIKLYAVLADNIGTYVPLWIFCASGFLGALFTYFYLPETKGKTLQQIQEKFKKSSKK